MAVSPRLDSIRESVDGSSLVGNRSKAYQLCALGNPATQQGLALNLPRFFEPGSHTSQVCVVVARMRDQLPGPIGHIAEHGSDRLRVQTSSSQNARRTIGGPKPFFPHRALKGRFKPVQQVNFNAPGERRGGSGAAAPERLKGVADGIDSSCLGGLEQGAQHCWEHVGVLVGVDVCEAQASLGEAGDLGCGFALNVAAMNAPHEREAQECGEFPMELPGLGVDEGWNAGGGKQRSAVDQNNVATDAKPGGILRIRDCIVSRGGVGHERGAGENAGLVELEDGAIYSQRQAKVVRVDNDSPHRPVYQPRLFWVSA